MITIYSKDDCPKCKTAEQLLSMYDIEFNEVNISKDENAKEFLISRGHKSLPQIYMYDQLFVENGLEGLMQLGRDGIINKLKVAV
jgi:glutaredoxin